MTRIQFSAAFLILLLGGPAAAQPRTARFQITVVDTSGGVIPGAAVGVVALDQAAGTAAAAPRVTDAKGVASIDGLVPGRYDVSATFQGFGVGQLRDVGARAGAETRLTVVLPLATLEDTVAVRVDAQENGGDRRTTGFGVALSNNQIDALADDPAELQRQLAELGGPDAVIRVDSFEGQQLPPKSQIKSIHVTRDQFAAEAANPGSTFVDVITQPGVGPIRGSVNFSTRPGSLTGKSQFVERRGAEQSNNYGLTASGTFVQGKTGFSASLNGQHTYTTPVVNVAVPGGSLSETTTSRQTTRGVNASMMVDHALTLDQTLRVTLSTSRYKRDGQGVGGYNLPERAHFQEENVTAIRALEAGPIGRRTFLNTRLSVQLFDWRWLSAVEKPTIVVQDAFTSGGAQSEQIADITMVNLASDIDHVRGIHSWRAGLQVDGYWFSATSRFNYLGTYTFSSLADYEAGRPALYTRSLGNPVNAYYNIAGAVYLQDDIRVKKGLTFSPGVRYSLQTAIGDRKALAPRFGMTWSPLANGATTIRASAGFFHAFMNLPFYEQTLRLNGERQREIYITNPSYPNPGEVEALDLPTNKYFIGEYNLQRNLRYSAGIDQALSPRVRVNALYNYVHVHQQPRGRNVNPLIDGARPNPAFANVIEAVTDGEIRRHELSVTGTVNFAQPGGQGRQRMVDWRRMNLSATYNLVHARANTDGAWSVPQTGDLDDDWGPGANDSPYRVQLLLTSTQVRNMTATLTFVANAGSPYTQTTGFDDNQDGFVTDRPTGVGLRSLRGAGQATLNARVQYALPLGGAATQPGTQARHRLNVFVNVTNVTNRQNLGGYSGVMTSPFYRQATLTLNPRRVETGMNVSF